MKGRVTRILVALAGFGFCAILIGIWRALPYASAESSAAAPRAVSLAHRTEDEQRTIDVYRRSQDAVVFISTITVTVDPFDFFQTPQSREGSGSGIIVDPERAIILTNLHVIRDAQKIEVSLANGRGYAAKLLGFDEEYDVAVLRLQNPPPALTNIPMGDSAHIEVGQRVLAIGNPFGLDRTLTAGIISSVNRTVRGSNGHLMRGLLQTDAAINPGNSGGPLLDADGRLIGINTAILSQSGDSAGIGFAVPINQIRRILPELIATGKVLRPKLGWVLVDTNQGPMIRRVTPGSPAEEAGLQPIERLVETAFVRGFVRDFDAADLILKVNGDAVTSREEVEDRVANAPAEKPLLITVRRGGASGREREVKVTPVLG